MIYLDTSFVIDLLRELQRGLQGPASLFLRENPTEELWISLPVACELAAGAELSQNPAAERDRIHRLFENVNVALPDERFAPVYGRLFADLRRSGVRISTMDLLIATAAVIDSAPLLTRNVRDFSRIQGLDLRSY